MKIMLLARGWTVLIFAATLLNFNYHAAAVLANAWHIPDNSGDLSGTNMRSPEFEIGTNTTVTIYSGIQKLNNPYGTANQTGGWVIYKGATQSSWSSNALGFYLNGGPSPNNQYWSATFNTSAFGANEVIQYYLYLTFDTEDGGSATVTNTYVYGGDSFSNTTAIQATAAAAPFTIRNRPAWLFHAGNRVVSANANGTNATVSFWIEIGYQSKDSSLRWADHGCVYYTTDGSTPAGSLGVGTNGTTQVMPVSYDHEQDNASAAGNAMWWVGTVTNIPNYTAINYKIGVWNSANNEEKFADYNAGTPGTVFNFSVGATTGTNGVPVLTVNGMNAEYSTEHLFVDEVAGDAVPVNVLFSPNTNNVTEADVFSNLNRRNRATLDANGDGIEDGIVPPDGNTIATGDDSNYYKAYTMTPVGGGQYALTLNATNCGAYRLTARYKISGSTNWFWYGLRDHCIVVSPPKARNMTVYELNAMNLNAQGSNFNQRSTFVDLVTNHFNLSYFTNLGVNWLWFQPIHPIGILNRQTDPNSGLPYSVGSPYSVKNFFQVNSNLSKAGTRDAGMQEFTNFVAAADAAGVNVMLDETFNHSAWDCELDAAGTNYFAPGANPTNVIMDSEARFYSRSGEYDQRAYSGGSVAQAPDRTDFGKWTDVADIYFGRYAALVPTAAQSTNYLSEADWFDYSIGSESGTGSGNGHFDAITQNVWRYFSDCILYWLDKTGCPSNTPPSQTYKGIDGLRADFGQGLPPQCWEYIINKVRTRKWDFVFMTESLDGGAVTYRSNRHFDVLNENAVFAFQSAATADDYRNIYDARRTAYGQGLVLWNGTSHDEESYADPFEGLIRYLAGCTIDGAPMIFYGQEMGISQTNGFDSYQYNFGKLIPNFMVYNDLQPVLNPANRNFGLDQLNPVFAAAGQARLASPALRSSNRYYLNQLGNGGGPQESIFSVAKYQTNNGAPNFNDVIFAFVNLDRNNPQIGVFNVNITQNGSNLFGIRPNRLYNVRNISAYIGVDASRRTNWLWGGGIAGSNVLANGVYVGLNMVPTNNSAWTTAPFEAQYLKLSDVTPPPALSSPPGNGSTNNYVMGNTVIFTWTAVTDAQGGISGYNVQVGTTAGGSDVTNIFVTGTSLTATGSFGAHLYATVTPVNNAGIASATSTTSTGIALVNPAWIPVASMASQSLLNWSSVSGQVYQVLSTTNLTVPFTAFSGMVTATAPTFTFTNSPTNSGRYFRIQLLQ